MVCKTYEQIEKKYKKMSIRVSENKKLAKKPHFSYSEVSILLKEIDVLKDLAYDRKW